MATNETSTAGFIPAIPPPPGVEAGPEYADRSLRHRTLAIAIVFPILALIFTSLRIYTARCIIRRLHFDDYMIITALLLCFGYSIVQFTQFRNGLGLHFWEISMAQFLEFQLTAVPAGLFYFLSILFAKVSVLCFYLRFSYSRPCRLTIFAVLVVTVGYSLVGAFGFTYLCQPVSKMWHPELPGKCWNTAAWYLTTAVLNSATDLVILFLPFWILRPLNVPWRQKCAILAILMAGGFVFGIGLFRLVVIIRHKIHHQDLGHIHAVNIIWCLVETGSAIICACLPCLKPLVNRRFPGIFARLTPRRARRDLEEDEGMSSPPTLDHQHLTGVDLTLKTEGSTETADEKKTFTNHASSSSRSSLGNEGAHNSHGGGIGGAESTSVLEPRPMAPAPS